MNPEPNTHALTGGMNTGAERSIEPVQIEVVDGPNRGAQITLRVGTLLIGSAPDCDLVLADTKVSRRHSSAELLPGAVRIRDLHSRNGTTYLGARIDEARVPIGGTIVVGKTTLRFAPIAQEAPESDRGELHGLIGSSRPMRQLFAMLERLGPSDSTVLIRGETGTGKDAVARALHSLSPRTSGRFVVFDCASVNSNLIESELFGHTRGAFTHANTERMGALEYANGGTIFFDEIGELPLDLQPKLLRAIENREFRRLGGSDVRKTTARVIAATHRDLEEEVKAGRFRADLYFRLAVGVVDVPPLRMRPEDIPLLARHFVKETQGEKAVISAMTMAGLQCESWPGNVRELRNAVERALALGRPKRAAAAAGTSFKQAREWLVQQFEREYLSEILERHAGNISAAARESGLSRSQFYRLLWQHGLAEKDEEKAEEKTDAGEQP
jgi:two-component system, NtrC family, nitrogen regulation response regulator GlnG